MLKPHHRSSVPISLLLHPVDEVVNLFQHVHIYSDHRFSYAKQKGYEGIVSKGGIESILRREVPPAANMFGNPYILSIQNPDTDRQHSKSRWIVQGHQDQQTHNISNNSPVLMHLSLRPIIAMAVTYFDFQLFSRDVEQAYFQSQPLDRTVYTTPPTEANRSDE